MNWTDQPETIQVDFLTDSGEPVRLHDLGRDFLNQLGVGVVSPSARFRIAVRRKQSKGGNAFYEYSQQSVPLPDGLSTYLRVEGTVVPMGLIHPSKKGHPTKNGTVDIKLNGIPYKVVVYIAETSTPYYVKMVCHKKPNVSSKESQNRVSPKGGELIL